MPSTPTKVTHDGLYLNPRAQEVEESRSWGLADQPGLAEMVSSRLMREVIKEDTRHCHPL